MIETLALGPDLRLLGPEIFVPFIARRLRDPRLIWLNERYWLARGIDVLNRNIRIALEEEIIKNYGFCVETPDNAHALTGESKTFFADRYGASSGTAQGGSGRCGVIGGVNIKGIGCTPLVGESKAVSYVHRHGCMWIEEAVREVIMSEVAYEEFPQGAVPIIAVIDCNFTQFDEEILEDTGRAIILRPNFVRLAHAQRSVFFGLRRNGNREQTVDARRVAEAVRRLWGLGHCRAELGIRSETLAESINKVAEQIAFAYSQRLFFGVYSSSNFTIDGEMVDFGTFTSVPNWETVYLAAELPAFGQDLPFVELLVRSVTNAQRKNLGWGEDAQEVMSGFVSTLRRSFAEEIASWVETPPYEEKLKLSKIVAWMRAYFADQQKTVDLLSRKGRRSWIYRHMDGVDRYSTTRPESSSQLVATAVRGLLSDYYGDSDRDRSREQVLWASIRRMTMPRPFLHRDRLSSRIRRVLRNSCNGSERESGMSKLIEMVVVKSLRTWRHLPKGFIIVSQARTSYSSLLYCYDPVTSEYSYVISALVWDGFAYLFGCAVDMMKLRQWIVSERNDAAVFIIPAPAGWVGGNISNPPFEDLKLPAAFVMSHLGGRTSARV